MMHYPPLIKDAMQNSFVDVLKKYGIKTCLYGHLHGKAQEGLIEGIHDGINYIMVSCDYTNFKVVKICD
jgi:predicted phosphohydrolase